MSKSTKLLPVLAMGVAAAGLAVAGPAAAKPTVGLRYASLTPDGKHVVFCYRGDVWVAQTDGKGMAMRNSQRVPSRSSTLICSMTGRIRNGRAGGHLSLRGGCPVFCCSGAKCARRRVSGPRTMAFLPFEGPYCVG